MSIFKYLFSKKFREEYSRQLVYKLNDIDEQIEKIYTNIKLEESKKAS